MSVLSCHLERGVICPGSVTHLLHLGGLALISVEPAMSCLLISLPLIFRCPFGNRWSPHEGVTVE